MATLITVSNSSGIVGRCDAKCHDARFPKCDCICGGMNHGCGGERAQENTNQHFFGAKDLQEFAEKNKLGIRERQGLQIDPIQTGLDL